MQAPTTVKASPVDIGGLLDEGPFGLFQKLVIALAATSVVLDGFDGQLIGFAIPAIARDWGIARGAFAFALAAGIFGMGVGSACVGLLADRFGRRWALIGSVLLFGFATCSVGLARNLVALGVLRFVAALGIGGAIPTSTTLAAEFTPLRKRTFVVTATIVCVPLGGMVAGFFARGILPAYGWRALFFIGGAIPILFSLLILIALPESPRFLVRHPGRWRELSRLLEHMSRLVAPETEFSDISEQKAERKADRLRGISALFSPDYLRDSIALWCAFFMSLFTIYSAFNWLPTMLASAGLGDAISSEGLTVYNLGGVIGALLCALMIGRYGSRWPMLICCAGAAGSALFLRQIHLLDHTSLLLYGLGVHGLFINAVQSTMAALCAHVYPTAFRATGTASAFAFGRIGAVVSAFAGAAVISASGSSGYLLMWAIAMLVVFIALASVRNHIPSVQAAALKVGRN